MIPKLAFGDKYPHGILMPQNNESTTSKQDNNGYVPRMVSAFGNQWISYI